MQYEPAEKEKEERFEKTGNVNGVQIEIRWVGKGDDAHYELRFPQIDEGDFSPRGIDDSVIEVPESIKPFDAFARASAIAKTSGAVTTVYLELKREFIKHY